MPSKKTKNSSCHSSSVSLCLSELGGGEEGTGMARMGRRLKQHYLAQISPFFLMHCMTWGRVFELFVPQFSLCKMGTITE